MSIEQIRIHFEAQDFEAAVSAASGMIAVDPSNVRALYWRACALMKLGDQGAAMDDLNNAIGHFDEYADAYSQRGVLYFQQGRPDKAMEDMNKAVDLDPSNPYRYSSRAYIKASMEYLESAIADYEVAIGLDPDDAVAHNNLGLLQEQLGYKSQAQRNLERAARLAVNDQGELVDRPGGAGSSAAAPSPVTGNPALRHRTFLQVVKDIFTSREGFRDYLRFLRGLIGGKKD